MKFKAAVLHEMGSPRPYAKSKPVRVEQVEVDPPQQGEVLVKVIEIDGNGKMRLSRKMALRDQPALSDKERLKNPQAANPPRD